MSTLPGLASKGEKGKSKYQSLDINNLWKVHTGEPIEAQHQKNTLPRKHGMQSLGKVPTARRPPANLPSLKSEHTGSDAAVSLVPSGGTGWGKQEGSPSSTTSQTTSVTNSTVSSSSNITSNSIPVLNQTGGPSPGPPSLPIPKQSTPAATPVTSDKSWSAVMSGNDIVQPPPYHSPQFQHEFPSLSAGDGAPTRPGTDMQYGPGPSLRPQNEGSWMQGGARPQPPSDLHSRNSNSAPPGASPQLSGPAGPPQVPLPQQYRGVIPPFMCRGNFASNGHGLPTFPNPPPAGAPKWGTGGPNRGVLDGRAPQSQQRPEEDEVLSRPILKEEDLSRMDDLSRDVGWASYDDIDYNQKLAFSDDESSPKEDGKENGKTDQNSDDRKSRSGGPKIIRHINEEEEVWKQRRMQQTEKVALAVERAKQRKEEEEKRFLEQKQAAAKKLQMLEEKMSKNKRERELEDTQGTISPLAVPPQPIMPAPIPVPEWEKEKENQTSTSSNNLQKTSAQQQQPKDIVSSASEFHKLALIEGRSFVRKDSHSVEREQPRDTREIRDQMGPNFSKQFQSNLPPRFKKQQQLRNIVSSPQLQNNNSNLQTTNYNSDTPSSYGSWQSNQQYKCRQDSEELDEKFKDNHRNDESSLPAYSNFNSYYDSDTTKSGGKYSEDDNKRDKGREEINTGGWEKEKDSLDKEKQPKRSSNQDIFEELQMHHVTADEWRDKYEKEDRYGEKYERPQRPDSRDSRASRDSRHSRESNRDFDYHTSSSSWADSPFDPTFDKKRKDNVYTREERSRVVPGPITKERVEAEDYKNDKGLTQLKRGMIIEKPIEKEKTPDKNIKQEEKESKEWAVDNNGNQDETKIEEKTGKDLGNEKDRQEINTTDSDNSKSQKLISDKDKEDNSKSHSSSNRRRQDPRGWGTGGAYVYRNSWKRNDSRRGGSNGGSSRFGGMKKSSMSSLSSKGPSDWPHTESDVSADEISSESIRDEKRSPKISRKNTSKDDKNKENRFEKNEKDSNRRDSYTPRGEPSRHGRGSSQFRSAGGRGGISRRIDGYGPPPSKSPFSHIDDKETNNKKNDNVSESEDNKTQNNAGVIGSNRSKDSLKLKSDDKLDGNKSRGSSNSRRNKSRKPKEGSEENCETSDNSEENSKDKSKHLSKTLSTRTSSQRRNNSGRPDYRLKPDILRQPNMKDEKAKGQDDHTFGDQTIQKDEKDTDGFQEVKSKKNLQRPKSGDEKIPLKLGNKLGDDRKDKLSKKPGSAILSTQQQSQFPLAQQVANIPSLMDTPVNPPQPMLAQLNKDKFERNRQNKLPPRFVRQRLQKVQINHHQPPQQQQSGIICDDINKVLLDAGGTLSSAWNKLRVESDSLECPKNVEQSQQQQSPNQGIDKVVQSNHLGEKPVLDGTTPPVNTIIFENTNFKSAPGARRNDKPCKLEEGVVIDNSAVMSNFNKPIRDLLNNKNDNKMQQQPQQQVDTTAIQMQLSFTKEDSADMKLDFFESELTHLTEDNKNSKNLGGLSRSIHTITSVNNTISTADALNFKIASVKKVWESMPTVMEHSVVVAQDDPNAAASAGFSTSFGADTGALDGSTAFVNKAAEVEDGHDRYNASPIQTVTNNTTPNVCKVKPTQQIAGSTSQTIHTTGAHQPHSGVVGPGIVGHPLSPPPMQPVIGTGVGLGQPPQQYTSNQHLGYQPSVGGTNQYGMSAIPSPPTVLFNSTQQLQAAAAQSGLYGTFQIDQSQVLGSQGRSQFSQYPNPYGLGQTASSPYSAQSMYLQGAQPHPPPAAQPPPPPDLYTNINSYRLSATGPFAQNQQLNNPTTVLISSTSNSLMSATVKPSTQQISAIGTKAGGVGQAYQQTSQQGQQLYMTYDPTMQAASYLPSTGVIQRGPNGPMQNVTALQPSASSYYTGSTGGQTAGFYQQPASSALQSAPLQQHQAAGYGIQGNMFGTPNQSHTSAGLQNFGSHFLSSPMQLAAAAALNAQQYRSQNLPNTTQYIKSMTGQHVGDQGTRQLKSPASQQDVLSSVFNSGPQIPSPKSKQNPKQPVPQSSPTAQHKYNLYQSVNTQQMAQMQRYPTPIQRPMNFQSSMGSVQPNSNGPTNNPKHKSSNQNQKMRHYYGSQGSNLGNSQHDKMDDKLSETATNNSSTTTSNAVTMANKSLTINSGGGGGVAVVGDAPKDQTGVVGANKNEETVVKE